MASLVSLKKERDDRTRQVLVDTDVLGKMPIEIQGFEWTTLVTMKKKDINNNCYYSFVTDNQLLSTREFQQGLWTHHLLPSNYNHLIDMIIPDIV